ncbi:MAG: response regulator [Chitinophagaceae bacterium]|nr:MAG: response regulator [Chitinophagaceae bacterium]
MTKVLLVDDDIDLLEMVCLMLRTNQLDANCLSKGKEVLACLGSVNPDIVVMDIFLGDSDGRDLCRQIKEEGQYAGIPVLLYSAGNIADSSISECHADDFIRKPFDMHVLVDRIRTLAKVN